MGKPAATDRPCLTPLSHSFTLDCSTSFDAVSIARGLLRGLAGIYYRSKYGHDIENWALFEPFQIDAKNPEPIRADDPDFERALQLHGLKFRK
jgi:hypothetical protein